MSSTGPPTPYAAQRAFEEDLRRRRAIHEIPGDAFSPRPVPMPPVPADYASMTAGERQAYDEEYAIEHRRLLLEADDERQANAMQALQRRMANPYIGEQQYEAMQELGRPVTFIPVQPLPGDTDPRARRTGPITDVPMFDLSARMPNVDSVIADIQTIYRMMHRVMDVLGIDLPTEVAPPASRSVIQVERNAGLTVTGNISVEAGVSNIHGVTVAEGAQVTIRGDIVIGPYHMSGSSRSTHPVSTGGTFAPTVDSVTGTPLLSPETIAGIRALAAENDPTPVRFDDIQQVRPISDSVINSIEAARHSVLSSMGIPASVFRAIGGDGWPGTPNRNGDIFPPEVVAEAMERAPRGIHLREPRFSSHEQNVPAEE